MWKIALTGGSGFIGSKVLEMLRGKAIVQNLNGRGQNRTELLNPEDVDAAIRNFRPHIILHIAGAKKPPFDVNVYGTFNLLNAAKKHRVKRFVFISSMHVYLNKLDKYAQSKLIAETLVQSFYPNALILRLPSAYGDGRFPFTFMNTMLVKSDYKRHFMEVHDIAREIVRMTLTNRTGIHDVSPKENISFNELARKHGLRQIPLLNGLIEKKDETK
jgi:nucleoside-diphosphate-sugar epimerase